MDTRFFEMLVDCGLVRQNEILVRAVTDAHDVDVREFFAALAPVGVGHAVMSADLFACLDFPARRDAPVEQRVELGDALAVLVSLDVLEEGRKPANQLALSERLGSRTEIFKTHPCLIRTGLPEIWRQFTRLELSLQRHEHLPLVVVELNHGRVQHTSRLVGTTAGLKPLSADVSNAEHEQTLGRQQLVSLGPGLFHQQRTVLIHRVTGRHLQRGPKLVVAAACLLVGCPQYDVARERVFLKHVFKGVKQFLWRNLPCNQRTGCQ